MREYCAIGELLPGMAYLVRRLLENTSNEGFLRLKNLGEASYALYLLHVPIRNGVLAAPWAQAHQPLASWLAIAATVLVPYAISVGQRPTGPVPMWGKFSVLAFIGHAAPFSLITWGTHFVSSGVSGP